MGTIAAKEFGRTKDGRTVAVYELCNGNGIRYPKNGGFCLEAQHYPDAMRHPHFPSTVLRPGETYRQKTVYRFTTK